MSAYWPETNPYAWVTDVGLDLDHFYDTLVLLPDNEPDKTGYYSSPLRVTRFIPSGSRQIDLTIASQSVHVDDIFRLCNMVAWADHYGLSSPWPIVLTAALGVFIGRDKDQYRPDPAAFTRVLHPLGIRTSWRSQATWVDAKSEIVATLQDNFPHCSTTPDGTENPAFLPLAQYRDLHLSAFAFYLATLIEHYD